MLARTLTRGYDSPVDAATTWAYVSDPVATSAAATHATTVPPMEPLRVGSAWDEYHLEDDCDFASVRWRCTALVPGRSLTVESLQAGARQRSTTTLADREDGGVRVLTRLRVSASLRAPGTLGTRLMVPVLLLTPLGAALLGDAMDESVQDDLRALQALA